MTDDHSSEEHQQRRERLIYVPVDHLSEGPHAPQAVGVTDEFVQSLKTYGVLHPLLVRPGGSGYEVIAGFKRLRGAKAAELDEVPVRVYRAEDASLKAMYQASNTGSSDNPTSKAPRKRSTTDGISSGSLGGLLDDELGRNAKPPPYGKIVGISAIILIVAWIGLLVSRNLGNRPPRSAEPTPTPETALTVEDTGSTVQIPQGPNTSMVNWQSALSGIDGISVGVKNGVPRVVFSEPVFSQLTTIDPDQKDRLMQITDMILTAQPRSLIMVVGHTDNDPIRANSRYRSNEYLSELRANAVIDFLVEANAAPASQLKPVAVGAEEPPFSNDNPADKVRNRTVTLEIMQPL